MLVPLLVFGLLVVVVVVEFVHVEEVRVGGEGQPLVAHQRNAHVVQVVQRVQSLKYRLIKIK
jgi:hypothetical protein